MGVNNFFTISFLLLSLSISSALPARPSRSTSTSIPTTSATTAAASTPINSNSVLVALLDSHYTELAELVEKALLLHTLENVLGKSNITIFAPKNTALERDLDPEFKRFLLEPGNLKSLQTLLLSHIIPIRLNSTNWPQKNPSSTHHHPTLSSHTIRLTNHHLTHNKLIDTATLTHPDDITRPDGIIHGISTLIIPQSVLNDFNRRRSLRSISAVHPTGAPELDPRTHRLKKTSLSSSTPSPVGAPPSLTIFDAMSPGPSLAPAPAPGPSGSHNHFHGQALVKDFISTLIQYGGYNELADILVNLTSLSTEMGRLISEGYVITLLAPNDEAMAKLTTDQLSEPGAPEQIMYYHMIPEYQTEESMYNSVRRFGKVKYDTLRLPHKIIAEEADGSVRFGKGDGSAYLFDPDIYTDGRISVQGIDGVLFPTLTEQKKAEGGDSSSPTRSSKVVVKKHHRRGKLLEVTCGMLEAFGQHSRFTSCLL